MLLSYRSKLVKAGNRQRRNSFDVFSGRFPVELGLLLNFLEPLSHDESGALSTYQFLSKMTYYCEEFIPTSEMAVDPENDNGWIRTAPFSPFTGMWNRDY